MGIEWTEWGFKIEGAVQTPPHNWIWAARVNARRETRGGGRDYGSGGRVFRRAAGFW